MNEWLGLQRQWMYLEPIFSSADINRQLPTEGRRFASVNKGWKHITRSVVRDPKAIHLCYNELLDKLRHHIKSLELVQKNLSAYLETKRRTFARFYFLADEDLIQILSQTKDPKAVQSHLGKCFEAIAQLGFVEVKKVDQRKKNNLFIVSMRSAQGEEMTLSERVETSGNVECWLGDPDLNLDLMRVWTSSSVIMS